MRYSSLLIYASALVVSTMALEKVSPIPSVRSPKNIAFVTAGGGSSHHVWVLEILKEMHRRGHQVALYSRGDQLKFADDYPMIRTKQVGGAHDFLKHPNVGTLIDSHPDQIELGMFAVESSMMNYTSNFYEYRTLFEQEQIGLVICDSFTISCIDAATLSKLPVMITSTMGLYADFSPPFINSKLYTTVEPTIETDSLWFRIYRDYYKLPKEIRKLLKKVKPAFDLQRKLGLSYAYDASSPRYNAVPKLANNLYGIELARSLSPLFHMVGPIMQSQYPALDQATAAFLANHQRVAYVAFGQHVTSSAQDIQIMMCSLLQLKQEKIIDGILWARLNPQAIVGKVNSTCDLGESVLQDKDIYLASWSPQFAILQHPSTLFFVSHGGVGSLLESLYNGVRLFVYPFFGDQPVNARSIARTGLGHYFDTLNLKFDKHDYHQLYDQLYRLATDPNNTIQTKVDRYKYYVQIRSQHAVIRGADLMEETIFASNEDGLLSYRKNVEYSIPWIKRYNIDIYAVFTMVAMATVKVMMVAMRMIQPAQQPKKHKAKLT